MGGAVIARVAPRGVLVAAISVAALGMPAAAPVAAQEPSARPPAVNPYAATGAIPGSGAGLTIGAIIGDAGDGSLDLIVQGIRDEAAIAGVVLVTCDLSAGDPDPVACAAELGRAAVDGVIAIGMEPGIAARACAAYREVPTVMLGDAASPCTLVRATTDDRAQGRMAGERLGMSLADERACAHDLVATLPGPSGAAADRLAGLVAGFASVCGPIPDGRLHRLPGATGDDPVGTQISDLLASQPRDALIVLLASADAPALEALAAADAVDRSAAIRIGSIGGMPSAWPAIGCHPSWIADTTSFPERYGRTLVPAIIDLLKGQDVPAAMTFPLAVLDRETIRSHYPDVPAC